MLEQPSGSNIYVYFSVFLVNLITFSSCGSLSWASPVLPKLSSPDASINPLPRPITTFEESWIAAVMNIGAIIGGATGGICSGKFGKKYTILAFTTPVILGHVLCALAFNVQLFIVARLLMGISVGMVFGVIPGYVADIAEVKNRGSLGSVLGVCNCSGILFMYLVGPFLSVRVFSLVNIIVPTASCIAFGILGPNSPYDLVKQGKVSKAEETLVKLRKKAFIDVQKEVAYISEIVKDSVSNSRGLSTVFKSRTSLKGLAISNSLLFFQHLSGIAAILGYMYTIFESTGSSISPTYSAIIIGVVQLFSSVVSAELIERLGRKLLLTLSYMFCIVALTSLGFCFFGSTPDWLPIASLIVYVIAFNLGLATVPWVMTAELFLADLKTAALAITAFFSFSLAFLVNMSFPLVAAALGMSVIFWTFAAVSFVGLVVCVTLLFETKGKTIEEIQQLLESKVK